MMLLHISWVKWKSVCKQKKNGGLGVKDVRVVKVSLLAKWRWRLLDGEKALWKEVLDVKYGPGVARLVEDVEGEWPRYTSLWWNEIVKLEELGRHGWFNSEVTRRVGNGLNTSFWNAKWRGDRSFSSKNPSLINLK